MEYIEPERIKKAKEMDLLTFKQLYEPYDLIPTGANSYRLKSEPSLKLSNGYWCWWNHDAMGGKSALKYLEKVREMSWQDAVKLIESISGAPDYVERIRENKVQNPVPKELMLPEKNADSYRMERYLTGRGISMNVIKYCEKEGLLYEDKKYHNAVFLGFDGDKPAYAFCRGTGDKNIYIESGGSNKEYCFRMMAKEKNKQVHVFEAAIDALSYASLLEMYGVDFRKKNFLSLGGVAGKRKEHGNIKEEPEREMKPPVALVNYLEENPYTEAVVLHLDNDEAGRYASEKIKKLFGGAVTIKDSPPPEGKDCNDYLKMARENERKNAAGKSPPAAKNTAAEGEKSPVPGRNLSAEAKKPAVKSAENLRDVT